MKTKKFLTFLAFAPLLTGCGSNVKAPKFVDYGKKVEYAKMMEDLKKGLNGGILAKEFKKQKLESLEAKMENKSLSSSEIIRDKKTISKKETTGSGKGSYKYDANEFTVKQEQQEQSKVVKKDAESTTNEVTKYDEATQMQIEKVNKKWFVVNADLKKSEYVPEGEVSKEAEGKEAIDGYVKNAVSSSLYSVSTTFAFVLALYPSMDAEMQKRFTFYESGKVFTAEYKYSEKDNEYKYAEEVKYVTNGEYSMTLQIDTTEYSWSSKFYQESTVTTDYKANYGSYAKGDQLVEKSQIATELTYAKKDVKVKKVDLSKFVGIGF